MSIATPFPFGSAFIEVVDEAIRAHTPCHGLAAIQRAWLAFCCTAILVTHAVCWARCARARLGTYSLAALSWRLRQSKIPWEWLRVASVRGLLRCYGLTRGCLVVDDTDRKRSKSAKTIAHLYKLREKESGGCMLGQSVVFLVCVPPTIIFPVGCAFYRPDPALTAWDKHERAMKQQGIPRKQCPPKPAPQPLDATKQALALGLLRQWHVHHPEVTVHCGIAEALYGNAAFLDEASALLGGVQVMRHMRSNQKVRVYQREQQVADYCATHPGTPHTVCVRGAENVAMRIGSARLDVSAHRTKRFVMALKYEGEAAYRYVMASELSWRTLDSVQAHTVRWLVEVFGQDGKGEEGWGTLPTQPGAEGARRSVILSLLGEHCLFFHPAQHAQRKHNLSASTVGSLRAHVQGECMVTVSQELFASTDPHTPLLRVCDTLQQVFPCERSTKPLVQRQLGRLELTPYLKYRAAEVLRHMPALST